jgi:hypothetical protein
MRTNTFPASIRKEWASIYGIELHSAACEKCGKPQRFTVPFTFKDFRGLIADHLDCGEEFRQSVFVSVDKAERLELATFVSQFSSSCP